MSMQRKGILSQPLQVLVGETIAVDGLSTGTIAASYMAISECKDT